MSAEIAVVDTNVLVAGILTARADAPTSRIVDGLLARRFAFALSEALLAEYRVVLLRPRIQKRHGLAAAEVDEILTRLALDAIVIDPVAAASVTAPDRGDQFLWDLLAALDRPILVTGEERLLQAELPGGTALSPRAFCRLVEI